MARQIALTRPVHLTKSWYTTVGIGGGIAAGIAMALVMMFSSEILGMSIWAGPQMIADTIPAFRDENMGWQLSAVVVGLGLHLITSVFWGYVFAALAPRIALSRGGLFGLGLGFGFVVMLIMRYLVVPIVNPTITKAPQPWFLIEHFVYGGVLALVAAAERKHLRS